jgi:hypothetical protein
MVFANTYMISKGKIMENDRYMNSYSGIPAHKSWIQAQGALMTEIEKIEMQQENYAFNSRTKNLNF